MSHKIPSRKQASRLPTPVRLCVAAVAACFISTPVMSLPVNPAVVNGAASFNQAGNVLTVTNSPGAIINWQKFSIQAGETTHFAQASASSSVLNRVLNDPTAIYGTLSSNGRVWLVNPAGIMVGPGGKVDVAGFVASTLNISNADFLAGRNVFINDGGAGNVVNQGEIRTPAGGSVYLIGSNVTNDGIIITPRGETILAAGATVSLIDSATPGVKVDITGGEGDATNLGTIAAEAGRIGIAGVVVRNSGQINASSVVSEGGRVFLKASQDAYVDGNGRIVTTGTKGGSVEVLGNRVAVTDNAEIDASGTNGGGKILVGGDYQGKNPEIQNALITYFGPDASLKADATNAGDGGTVVVWADDTTRAYGSISARGGALGGNGGLVETSGHRALSVTGARVDTRAPKGETGSWLLDPTNIDIVAGGYSTLLGSIFDPLINSEITDGDVNFALGYSNLTIQTSGGSGGVGNINVTGANIYGGSILTLAAYGGGGATGNINIYGSTISLGGFTALAGWNGGAYDKSGIEEGVGDITISASQIFTSGNIDLHAGNDITLGHQTTSNAGTWIDASGTMSVSAKNLSLFGGSATLFDISGQQGPGVMLRSNSAQEIEVENQILLRAGSANNTVYAGSVMYGGSVSIQSGADQEISAKIIKVHAGASGHDSSAGIQADGNQSIIIEGPGGLLEVKGGGDGNALVFGGAGSFNNQAGIRHGQYGGFGTGDQTITVYGGGTVTVTGGSGTGALGYYGSDCASATGDPELCRGSNNNAVIENDFGMQTLAFVDGGSLTVTGGGAGDQNWAGFENDGGDQYITGVPDITLNGGTGGRVFVYGGDVFDFYNDAGIYNEGSGGQFIYGGSIAINGGGNAISYGGAGIGNEGTLGVTYIGATGNLTMNGGASNVYGGSNIPGEATAAFINSEAADNDIKIEVGGNINLVAGNGYGGAVLIGTVHGGASSVIDISALGTINVASGTNSFAAIGNLGEAALGGADVIMRSGGNLTVTGTTNAPVMIGSLNGGTNPTNVTLGSMRNVTLTRANIGSWNADAASIAVYGGFMDDGLGNPIPSPYGGNLSFTRTRFGSAVGDAAIAMYAAAYGGAGGNISFSDGGGAYGASIDIVADRNLTLDALSRGVRLQTTTGPMSIKADNFFAYGGNAVRGPDDVNLIGQPVPYGGAQISILAGTGGQIIEVDGTMELKAGSINNSYGGNSSYYGAGVTITSAGTQTISAGGLTLEAGASGHDNAVSVNAFGDQAINVYGGGLTLRGGGSVGSYNNYVGIFQDSSGGTQTINVYDGGSLAVYGGAGTGMASAYYTWSCGYPGANLCSGQISWNNARIRQNGSGDQTINFDDGGALWLEGGSGGNLNRAMISAEYGGAQIINGTAAITLKGGASGGTYNAGADAFLDNGALLFAADSTYTSGSQTIYGASLNMNGGASAGTAGAYIRAVEQNITISGNAALNGGSGTGFHNRAAILSEGPLGQIVSIGGNLVLQAGGSGNTNDAGIRAYGGALTLAVGGTFSANGGAGGVNNTAFLGSTDTTSLTISAGNSITATGNTGGVGLQAAPGGDVVVNAGWDPALAAPSGSGGDITLNGPVFIQAPGATGNVSIVAYESGSGTLGSVTLGGGTVVYGDSISVVAGGNNSVSGTLVAAGNLYFDAGWDYYSGTSSLRGGDLTLGTTSRLQAGFAEMYAQSGTATPYGGGNIIQNAGSSVVTYGGDIEMYADRDATLNGSVTSYGGYIFARAGYAETRQFGGNLSVSGVLSGEYGVDLVAESGSISGLNGNITQYGGSSITANDGEVKIIGGGNVELRGIIDGGEGFGLSSVTVKAGYSDADGMPTLNGGNILLTGTSSIYGYGGIYLNAESGSASGANGGITQNAGSSITGGSGNVTIIGGGNIALNGNTNAYGGSGTIKAGTSAYSGLASANGGNLQISGNVFADYSLGLSASAGSLPDSGNITQNAGSRISTGVGSFGDNITIVGARNVTLGGTVSSGYEVNIGAGLDPQNPGVPGAYGGGITFNAGSLVEARNDVEGTAIAAITYGGNILQAAGSQLLAGGYGDIKVLAWGDALMDGTTTISDASGYGIYVAAGAENASGLSSSFGAGTRAGSSNIVTINRFNSVYGGVEVEAGGAILRSASNPSGTNIVADTVDLISVNGGSSNALAISAITEATGSISASVNAGASYGGVSIINLGAQPISGISLTDAAASPGLNGGTSISFFNSGDLALDGSAAFSSSNSGDIAIVSGGSLDYDSGLLPGSGDVLLGAQGGALTINGSLTATGTLGLSAGGSMNINNDLSGSNVTLVAPVININDAMVGATNDAILTGSAINIFDAGEVNATNVLLRGLALGAGNLALSNGGQVNASGQLEFNLANINAYGGHLAATSASSNITGFISGNVTLDNGSYFESGDDIILTFSGGSSKIALSNGSYVVSDTQQFVAATTYLTFLGRSSGGILIDGVATDTTTGSSGFFVFDTGTPATTGPGGGLVITYANKIVVDPCASSPDLCKPPPPNENPFIDVVEADPCATAPDSAQCKAQKPDDEDEDHFGDDQENGKKDEKSSQKKVAQCGI